MENRTILVADDESPLRTLIGAILAEDGYHVLEAEDGMEALHIARTQSVDLLITDVLMPRMNGPELINCLREEGLVARFLLISGYAGDSLANVHGVHERVPFLQKPFEAEALLRKVRDALNSRRSTTSTGQGFGF